MDALQEVTEKVINLRGRRRDVLSCLHVVLERRTVPNVRSCFEAQSLATYFLVMRKCFDVVYEHLKTAMKSGEKPEES